MFFFFYLFLARCIYGCSTIVRLNHNDTMLMEVGCGASAVREGYATLYVGSPEDCGSMLEDPVGYPPDLAPVDLPSIGYEVTIDLSGQYLVESLESIVGGTALPDPAQSTQEGVTELGYIASSELETPHSNHLSYQKRQTEKKQETELCGKSLGHKNYLRTYNKKDTEGRWFECSTCGKPFNDPSNLIRHQNIHTRKKQYECGLCSRIFLQKSNLMRHEKRHRGEKSYVCATCSKGYVTKFELKTHEKTHRRKPV